MAAVTAADAGEQRRLRPDAAKSASIGKVSHIVYPSCEHAEPSCAGRGRTQAALPRIHARSRGTLRFRRMADLRRRGLCRAAAVHRFRATTEEASEAHV